MPRKKLRMQVSESSLKRYNEIDISNFVPKKSDFDTCDTAIVMKSTSSDVALKRISRDYTTAIPNNNDNGNNLIRNQVFAHNRTSVISTTSDVQRFLFN